MATKPAADPVPAQEVWTVTQLARRVKGLLEEQIGPLWVSGEISNWRVSPAGHAYFTLKDDQSQVRTVMFRGRLGAVRFEPENGLEVLVRGLASLYEARGDFQIICEEMQPRGVGALQLAFEKLKAKLEAEGLFNPEHKKPLPLLPRRIGVVTSPTGAAIRDILNVIHRRFAHVHVILYPARVQGDGAAAEIVQGIRALDEFGVDVMIVGRGGGSLEDLWSFNEEPVVRAIYAAKTPIISAVGHEIDFTLADFAADVRAPTPSAAAELVVKEQQALAESIANLDRRMRRALVARVELLRGRLDRARTSVVFRRPEELLRQLRQRADDARMAILQALQARAVTDRHRLEKVVRALSLLSPAVQVARAHERLAALRRRLLGAGAVVPQRRRARFQTLVAQLDALSPLAILGRGYALAWKQPGDRLVRSARQLKPGDKVRLKFGLGGADASIEQTTEG
jgi:exodeoxyribonuclease VII large subunit